jgi:hypothetical protein
MNTLKSRCNFKSDHFKSKKIKAIGILKRRGWFHEPKRSLWSPVQFGQTVRFEFKVLRMSSKHAEIMHAHHTVTLQVHAEFSWHSQPPSHRGLPSPASKQSEWSSTRSRSLLIYLGGPTHRSKPKKPASIWQQLKASSPKRIYLQQIPKRIYLQQMPILSTTYVPPSFTKWASPKLKHSQASSELKTNLTK